MKLASEHAATPKRQHRRPGLCRALISSRIYLVPEVCNVTFPKFACLICLMCYLRGSRIQQRGETALFFDMFYSILFYMQLDQP